MNAISTLVKYVLCLALVLMAQGCGQGTGFVVAPESEAFGQFYVYNNKVDILWVVDDSESMGTHQDNIAKQFGAFIDVLTARGMDFHLAVTTADMSLGGEKGNFVGSIKVLNSSTPNLKTEFGNNIRVGTSGSALTRGFEAMKASLDPNKLANENAGFLRDDARLAVIFISDDEDKSPGTVTSYSDFLTQLKPAFQYGARGWISNFIGVTDLTGSCTTGGGGQVYVGYRFLSLTTESGGEAASICSNDLTVALSSIQSRVVGMITEYILSREPIIDSIEIFINEEKIPKDDVNGWSYFPEKRLVRFNGTAVPPSTAAVRIDYQPVTSK